MSHLRFRWAPSCGRSRCAGIVQYLIRLLAALLSLGALGYGGWQVWTALGLSAGAPLGWRLQLCLLEGGVPALLALGFGVAALGGPRARNWGWFLVVATLVVFGSWVSLPLVPPSGPATP